MGILYNIIKIPNLYNYESEFNKDGTEKHIICEGAYYHIPSWNINGIHCSEQNCEVNHLSVTKSFNNSVGK